MQFFENDWITFSFEPIPLFPHEKKIVWTIRDDITIPKGDPKELIINAVKRMDLGDKPVVALSGGIDSQSTCLMLKMAGIKFTTATLVFEDNLNSMDVENVKLFCDKHNITNTLVDINIMDFLRKDLHDYVMKYECPSPQITAHFSFYERIIKEMGATSILAGGNAPYFINGRLIFDVTRSQNAWTIFSEKNNFKLYGNFLAYSFDIASLVIIYRKNLISNNPNTVIPYSSKFDAYKAMGLDVIPQENSFTGFEKIKKMLEEITGDGWTFEKMFRRPYQVMFEDHRGLLLESKIEKQLVELNIDFINNSDK
jgi:hypothetical protein